MGHNVHNLNQYHHINNYNNHPSECEITSKLKDLKEEDSQLSMSNIEVKCFTLVLLLGLFNYRIVAKQTNGIWMEIGTYYANCIKQHFCHS